LIFKSYRTKSVTAVFKFYSGAKCFIKKDVQREEKSVREVERSWDDFSFTMLIKVML